VATIPSSQTLRIVQPAPLTDPATALVDAGNWTVAASWPVPSSATSGIYFARLTRDDTGGASFVLFVVRDDDGHSDLLFQTSDTTWQAYNDWGGTSFYAGPLGVNPSRAYKVSYNRPFMTRTSTLGGRDFGGLDGIHDNGPTTPDQSMRQATVNLFADMGVQPGTLQAGLVLATMTTDVIAPTSVILSPSSGANLQVGIPVTITGAASDTGGGRVGGIEVSVDGGKTWRRATGRENWSYTWTPAIGGPILIQSRATDDSANIGNPLASVSVNVTLLPTSASRLVASYNFNQASGTTLSDLSGNGHNGTITNATWTNSGHTGSALSFNGSSSWVTIDGSSSLNLVNGMTLEAWIKPANGTGPRPILVKEGTGTTLYALYGSNTSSVPSVSLNANTTGSTVAPAYQLLALNTWNHVAHLWSAAGTLLATATFTGETSSGWQQVSFTTPVAIAAHTTYIVSYFAPAGGYAVNDSYFTTTEFDNGPLHAPSSAAGGGNGVYVYGSSGGFPINTFNGSNYWVDPIFVAASGS
jgi:hypothetical protein